MEGRRRDGRGFVVVVEAGFGDVADAVVVGPDAAGEVHVFVVAGEAGIEQARRLDGRAGDEQGGGDGVVDFAALGVVGDGAAAADVLAGRREAAEAQADAPDAVVIGGHAELGGQNAGFGVALGDGDEAGDGVGFAGDAALGEHDEVGGVVAAQSRDDALVVHGGEAVAGGVVEDFESGIGGVQAGDAGFVGGDGDEAEAGVGGGAEGVEAAEEGFAVAGIGDDGGDPRLDGEVGALRGVGLHGLGGGEFADAVEGGFEAVVDFHVLELRGASDRAEVGEAGEVGAGGIDVLFVVATVDGVGVVAADDGGVEDVFHAVDAGFGHSADGGFFEAGGVAFGDFGAEDGGVLGTAAGPHVLDFADAVDGHGLAVHAVNPVVGGGAGLVEVDVNGGDGAVGEGGFEAGHAADFGEGKCRDVGVGDEFAGFAVALVADAEDAGAGGVEVDAGGTGVVLDEVLDGRKEGVADGAECALLGVVEIVELGLGALADDIERAGKAGLLAGPFDGDMVGIDAEHFFGVGGEKELFKAGAVLGEAVAAEGGLREMARAGQVGPGDGEGVVREEASAQLHRVHRVLQPLAAEAHGADAVERAQRGQGLDELENVLVAREEAVGRPVAGVAVPDKAVGRAAGDGARFDEFDFHSALVEKMRGRQAGHAGADDSDFHTSGASFQRRSRA